MLYKSRKLYPAKLYLKLQFQCLIHYRVNLKSPKTFNEKLLWLKLYDRNPLYTILADKYLVKKYVSDIIGDEFVVPNYGVWDNFDDINFDDINFDNLPNEFVLKTTHDSSGVIICKDKKLFDLSKVKIKLNNSLKMNYYWPEREWPYKNIRPRIIADKFLDSHNGTPLLDYKFWCFNGRPTYMYCTVKDKEVFENFYDMDFNPVNINHGFPRRNPEFNKPVNFDVMKELAERLSTDIPFVRIDFFNVDGRVYFGEFTFYDWGGVKPFANYDIDLDIGSLISLPVNKIS